MSIKCWFCEKAQVDEECENNIVYVFYKQSHADKIKKNNKRKEKLIIGRCDNCYDAHQKCKRISLYCIIPYTFLAFGILMMFEKKDPILVAVILLIAAFGLGVVSFVKSRYLKNKNIKALVQMEIKNEDIQHYLADGWYR